MGWGLGKRLTNIGLFVILCVLGGIVKEWQGTLDRTYSEPLSALDIYGSFVNVCQY